MTNLLLAAGALLAVGIGYAMLETPFSSKRGQTTAGCLAYIFFALGLVLFLRIGAR